MSEKQHELTSALDLELGHIQVALTSILTMTTNGKIITTVQNAKSACDRSFNIIKELKKTHRRGDGSYG